MNFQLVIADIDPNKISFAKDEITDLAVQNFIYEHLRYFCSKFFPIPSIMVKIEHNSILAISRSVYLQIAKDLNLPTIRAVINESSDKDAIDLLAEKKEITLLDYQKLRDTEHFVNQSWHVFFFEQKLTQDEKDEFKNLVFEQFKSQSYLSENEKNNAISSFNISHSGKCVEFKGLTPSENHDWANSFRQKLIDFHSKVAKITSYQGHKFLLTEIKR